MDYRGYSIISTTGGWAVSTAAGCHHVATTRRAARAWCDRHVMVPREIAGLVLREAVDHVLGHASPTEAIGCLQRHGVPDAVIDQASALAHWAFCPERTRERN